MKTILDYADLVKEQHALNTTIAPVETDLTSASKAYAVGQKFIHDGVLYQAKTAIAQGAALVLNTNYEAADDVSSEIEALTKEVTDAYALMGRNGAKNHVHVTAISQTINGVTFTVNDDGSIKANGTATEFTAFDIETTATGLKAVSGNYLLSDGLANPSASHYTTITVVDKNDVTTYDYANTKDAGKQAFSIVAEDIKSIYLAVCIGANVTVNDLVFYPMVRDAEDIDSDFQPYAKTNQQLTAENQTLTNEVDTIVNDLSAKNIAQIELAEQSLFGVTLSIVDNAMIKMNGTATASSARSNVWKAHLKPGTYIASIDVISGSHDTSKTIWFEKNSGTTGINPDITITTETHKEKEFTVATEGDYHFQIGFQNEDAFINLVVAYMIRPAIIKDGTFVPYTMTNRELTENLNGNYAVVSLANYVEVTPDGTETNEAFLKRFRSAAISLINASLGANEKFKILGFNYNSRTFGVTPIGNGLGNFSDDYYYAFRIEATLFECRTIQPFSGTYFSFKFSNGTSSIDDLKSQTASGSLRVYYDKYRKIV